MFLGSSHPVTYHPPYEMGDAYCWRLKPPLGQAKPASAGSTGGERQSAQADFAWASGEFIRPVAFVLICITHFVRGVGGMANADPAKALSTPDS